MLLIQMQKQSSVRHLLVVNQHVVVRFSKGQRLGVLVMRVALSLAHAADALDALKQNQCLRSDIFVLLTK